MRCISYLAVCLIMAVKVYSRRNGTVQGPEIGFLNVEKVWKKGFTGKGVVVGVVDHGVNKNHPDLKQNYNASLSYDFVNNIPDPDPNYVLSHGTKCAGVIAAKQYGRCRKGIAYNAQFADLRVINGTFAHDKSTAKGLKYKRNKLIDIYSNSWGPFDNGYMVHGPGPLVKAVLKKGVERGRHHRGSIFIYSSGNGGMMKDSCAFDGFVNSIYTIAIGGVSKSGKVPKYAESCSSVLAVTYADNVDTSDVTGCVQNFGKTSASAAMASGIIALLLEANNQLTWRDVQHLIVRTSRPNREVNNGQKWIINGAGLMVHPALGFGIMDANKLVDTSINNWRIVPAQEDCSITKQPNTFDRRNNVFIINPNSNQECRKIKFIEHVQVEFSLTFPPRGLLEMYLQSPYGTKSQLIYPRLYDALTRRKNYKDLVVTSLHFWGEDATAHGGKWKLSFESAAFRHRNIDGKLSKFKITFYGTDQDPIRGGGLARGMTSCKYGIGYKYFWSAYGSSCCGTVGLYDHDVAKCCNGKKLVPRSSFCGSVPYDQCTQICCDGYVHRKVEGITSCCGENSYNLTTQICCNRRPEQKYRCVELQWYNWGKFYINESAKCGHDGVFYQRNDYEQCRNPCRSRPCENRGRCIPDYENLTFTCQCASGYQGKTCAHRVIRDPCQSEPCKNGGRCSSNPEDFRCHCANGYTGKTCSVCQDDSETGKCEDWKTFGYCRRNDSKWHCANTCNWCN